MGMVLAILGAFALIGASVTFTSIGVVSSISASKAKDCKHAKNWSISAAVISFVAALVSFFIGILMFF